MIFTAGSVVFKKSPIVKMFSIRLSIGELHPSFSQSEGASSIEVELWGGGGDNSTQLLFGCPVFQHSVSVCVCVECVHSLVWLSS